MSTVCSHHPPPPPPPSNGPLLMKYCLSLQKTSSPREVSHMKFTSWKERAMPNVALFVGFVTATREARKKYGDIKAPTIVHCRFVKLHVFGVVYLLHCIFSNYSLDRIRPFKTDCHQYQKNQSNLKVNTCWR